MSRDIYQEVTDRIIAALEQGTAPWVRPWRNNPAAAGMPYNAATGRHYNGVNVLLLWMTGSANGYATPGWMTFKQAKERGAYVRKGEHGTQVVYWDRRQVEDKDKPGELKTVPFLKIFTVFNVAQIEGLKTAEPLPLLAGPEHVEAFLANTGATIRHAGNSAFYNRRDDLIVLPTREQFQSLADYYATALHELTHWTGHESRLARDLGGRFGSESYAAEELVAEMGAAFLCASLGIEGKLQHPSYIEHWLKVLRQDKRAIFTAAKHATSAADYLKGLDTKAQPLAA